MAPLTDVSRPELEAFLCRYDLGALAGYQPVEGGTVNTSFAIELAAKNRVFLRIYEEQGRAGAEREASLLAHLAKNGVATPSPIPMQDGALVGELRGKPAALFPWVAGRMRCQAAVRPGDTKKVGAALARLHLAGAGFERIEGRFDAPSLELRLDQIARAPSPELASQAEPLRARLASWTARRDGSLPRGVIHGDLFRDNVLWDGDDIVALLDFESACDGTFAYDVMVAILSWCVGEALDASLARALVEGYESVRPLGEAERAGLLAEGCSAALRFTITRITDRAMRGLTGPKDWRRFRMRLEALEQLGERGLRELLGL